MKCKLGHTLSSVYYFQSKPNRTMATISGFAYCVECKTLFEFCEYHPAKEAVKIE